ncbi:uncharacterized protein LOC143348014 isoform X1 [Colletes latitarsis]|uniref:uncharacterized protein LOC143348014 isoform X1 n=1 Tax=Colletes latitarsis TaxID=2605962 RepID=UPI00403525D7
MHLMYQLLGSAIPMLGNIAIFCYVCQRVSQYAKRILFEIEEGLFSTISNKVLFPFHVKVKWKGNSNLGRLVFSSCEIATQDHGRDGRIYLDRNVYSNQRSTTRGISIDSLGRTIFSVCQQVRRARDNLQYIGDQVTKGMEEIKEDVGEELRVTDRLTTQSTRLAAVLGRFATLEENVIELVRMERNRENAMIETPVDVNEEIRKIVAAVESKKNESQEQDRARPTDGVGPAAIDVHRRSIRDSAHRNPVSKFSAYGPREVASVAKKTLNDRARTPITPEVRLLGELDRPVSARDNSKRE